MKNLLDLFIKFIDAGEKQYVATIETMHGDEFIISLKAYNTADALMKIEDYTGYGCNMTNIRIIDEHGNVY